MSNYVLTTTFNVMGKIIDYNKKKNYYQVSFTSTRNIVRLITNFNIARLILSDTN